MVSDEAHHPAEMSTQRSTYVTKGAFPQTAYQRLAEKKEDRDSFLLSDAVM